jgi:hypothetical protein
MQNDKYYQKYLKYKSKYIKNKQSGGEKVSFPTQDVYENSIEPVWKNIIANEINDFVNKYYNIMDNESINKLNNFIEQFDSLYELDGVLNSLKKCSESITNDEINPILNTIVYSVESRIKELMEEINVLDNDEPNGVCDKCVTKTPYTVFDIGRIANKKVFILDQHVYEFSANTNYLESIGKLLSPYSELVPIENRTQSYFEGFILTEEEKNIIVKNVNEGIPVNNSMLVTLLNLDRNIKYGHDLTIYEIRKNYNKSTIETKMSEVTLRTYFYIGKLFGIISSQLFYKKNNLFYTGEIIESDPIRTFLLFSGVVTPDNPLIESISRGFLQMSLSHIAHGMSSAELVARIASSVRTSYPQALISALCVRSGAYHGGAMVRAIPMIIKYFEETDKIIKSNNLTFENLDTNTELNNFINTYVNGLLSSGKVFGFGHRIHKSPDVGKPCADPRALEYLHIVKTIYNESEPVKIKLIEKFLETIRLSKPTLGCNSDFAIAVFCVLTLVPDSEAEGMFVMCRIPGFCARIVRELLGKPNSRRLPFAPILPYIPPKN